jgi:hypothetical protein
MTKNPFKPGPMCGSRRIRLLEYKEHGLMIQCENHCPGSPVHALVGQRYKLACKNCGHLTRERYDEATVFYCASCENVTSHFWQLVSLPNSR